MLTQHIGHNQNPTNTDICIIVVHGNLSLSWNAIITGKFLLITVLFAAATTNSTVCGHRCCTCIYHMLNGQLWTVVCSYTISLSPVFKFTEKYLPCSIIGYECKPHTLTSCLSRCTIIVLVHVCYDETR